MLRQERDSDVTLNEADLALGLRMNGFDESLKQGDCGFVSTPLGDPMDLVTKQDNAQLNESSQKVSMQSLLGGDEDGTTTDAGSTDDQLKNVYESYSNAAGEEKVPFTIAGYALEHARSLTEKGASKATLSNSDWIGSDKRTVSNFVSEELYIHAKVPSSDFYLMKAYDCRWYHSE